MKLSDQNTPLRSAEMFERYLNRTRNSGSLCFMCTIQPIGHYDHWLIIPNQYPYDVVAAVHHMLIPKSHTALFEDLSYEEAEELAKIRKEIEEAGFYDSLLENFMRGRSHPSHFHMHLLQWKRI